MFIISIILVITTVRGSQPYELSAQPSSDAESTVLISSCDHEPCESMRHKQTKEKRYAPYASYEPFIPVPPVVGGRDAVRAEFPHMRQKRKGMPYLGNAPSVVGGRDAIRAEFPHMGAIGWKAVSGDWLFMCGGSLISPRYVLSAAHCSAASPRDSRLADIVPKIVRLGHHNLLIENRHLIDMNISRFINHPLYAPPKKYYDIAIVELAYDVQTNDFVKPACLWTSFDVDLNSKGIITGWGATKSGSLSISNHLQAADVDFIESGVCDRLLRSSRNRVWSGLQHHQLCAGKLEGGVDSCGGDSGGPLQIKKYEDGSLVYYIVGVTSFGIKCAYPDLPGVYTRVASFIDWIYSIAEGNNIQ